MIRPKQKSVLPVAVCPQGKTRVPKIVLTQLPNYSLRTSFAKKFIFRGIAVHALVHKIENKNNVLKKAPVPIFGQATGSTEVLFWVLSIFLVLAY